MLTANLVAELILARERVASAVVAYDSAIRVELELNRRLDEARSHTGRMMVAKQDAIAEVRRLQESLVNGED